MKRKYHDLQLVKVRVERGSSVEEWIGNVISAKDTGLGEWEYEVSNGPFVIGMFPLLAWESEITPFV